MTRLIVALLLCLFAADAAQARHHHDDRRQHRAWTAPAHSKLHRATERGYAHLHRYRQHYASRRHHGGAVAQVAAVQELAHPSGCPSSNFCGCGASIEVFGHSVRDLWLAANWFRFPSVQAAPGMVAVRSHHVMVIRSVVGPGVALVYDANSGHHRTQVHTVSLAGYSIRNPHAGG